MRTSVPRPTPRPTCLTQRRTRATDSEDRTASSSGATRPALRALLLAAADDELILGHRHSEWTGFAPDIESDVALSSIAQEEMGHARLLYDQAAALGGTGGA